VFLQLTGDPATGVRLLAGRLLGAPELGPGLPPWVAEVPGKMSAAAPSAAGSAVPMTEFNSKGTP